MISQRMVFEDIHFMGTSNAVQKALELGALYSADILRCDFTALGVAVDLQFCLNGLIEHCMATNNVTGAFLVRNGVWTGAGLANAQSNHTTLFKPRVYCAPGATYGIHCIGASGVHIDDAIIEGSNPVDCIRYDAAGSTVAKVFKVSNLHNENVPTGSLIRVIGNGGFVDIDTLYQQSACTLVDATGSTATPLLRVANIVWTPGSQFNAGGAGTAVWQFERIGAIGQNNLDDAGFWVGGTKPNFWNHRRLNTEGGIYAEEQGSYGVFQRNPTQFMVPIKDMNGANVVGARGAALPADAADLATAIALSNAIKARLKVTGGHGLVAD
jgi:hypothetical protein